MLKLKGTPWNRYLSVLYILMTSLWRHFPSSAALRTYLKVFLQCNPLIRNGSGPPLFLEKKNIQARFNYTYTYTYAGIGTWRPDTIWRPSLYLNNLIGGLHCPLVWSSRYTKTIKWRNGTCRPRTILEHLGKSIWS